MLPLTDLKTATLYYQYVRFTRRHDWWRVINHVPCMKDCHWINRMMSLYDITESAPENTVPKYRRNGARYGQTACVGGCVDRWSSSQIRKCPFWIGLNECSRCSFWKVSLEMFCIVVINKQKYWFERKNWNANKAKKIVLSLLNYF